VDLSFLPAVNAGLNGLACSLLIAGWVQVKKKRIAAHRRLMLCAAAASGVFLACYVTHYIWRYLQEGGAHTTYNGTGWIKAAYYVILLSHIVLAVAVPVLAMRLIILGLSGQIARHRRLARIGLPIWVYVSVTGVVIYFMLYWFNPLAVASP